MFDENREKHFQTVERTLPTYRSLLITIKECLNNKPECRPMASQLLTSLDRMKSTNEGSHTTIAKTNAVSQVLTALNFARIEHKLKVRFDIRQLFEHMMLFIVLYTPSYV